MNSARVRRKLILPSLYRFNHFTIRGVLIVVVILSLFQLYISNKFVTEGEKINKDQLRASALEEENLLLKNEIQKISSLKYIEEKALSLGFGKIEKIEYLDQSDVFASR
jgi:hypothetical protein